MRRRRLGVMFELQIAFTEALIPEDNSARAVWAVIAAVILGLYVLTKRARANATEEYWKRRRADEERKANDPDMRKD